MSFKIFIAVFVLCLPAATGEASDRPTAPPRSVAAQMSEIVCTGAHKSRPNRQMAQAKPSDPPAIKFYRSRHFLAGFLLRASKVCQGGKQDIEIAFSLLGTNELKAFSQNFPAKSEQWMTEGANSFNTEVLQNGIPETCNFALEVQKRAQQIIQSDQ